MNGDIPNYPAADLSLHSNRSVGKRVVANSGLMVGSKTLAAVMGLVSLTIAAKSLDSTLAFGTIMFLHAYMLFFSEVATFQAWQGIIRFGSDDVQREDAGSLAKLLKFGIILDFISAVAAYFAAIGLFSVILWVGSQFPNLVQDSATNGQDLQRYVNLYCLVILFRQRGTSIGIFRLFDKFRVLAIKAIIMPATRLIGAFIAAYLGWGLVGFLCVWAGASLISYIFLPTAAMLELKSRGLLRRVLTAKSDFFEPRAGLWPFTIKSNIDSTISASQLHLPMLLVTAIFGPAFAGIYKIAEEAAKLLSEGFKLFDQVIYPEIAKMISSGDGSKIWRLVTRTAAILLGFGAIFSLLLVVLGPETLSAIFGKDYALAAPLASLLVPAAALLGVVAPLYPIYYAADCPEKAIYARGLTLAVYIIALFALSGVVGQMAPGWAAIAGNVFAVIFVGFTARRALNRAVKPSDASASSTGTTLTAASIRPVAAFVGQASGTLWSMPIAKWQSRAMKKAGADVNPNARSEATVCLDPNWVLSSGLAKAFVSSPNIALVQDGIIIGINLTTESREAARNLVGQAVIDVDLSALNLTPKSPTDLAGSYNKALRKTEPPYALNINTTPRVDIMRRQFASSYKGITDFVTKYAWPIPAFYATRACAAMRLSPNMVTTVGLILTIAATYYFYHGQWALGFATGWMMTFLDTVDGKLARTTMTYSSWGNIYDHGIDLIHPPFWYYAWFIGLGGVLAWPEPLSIALIALLVGYVVDRVIEGIFIAQHGFHIHVWRPFNSLLRIYTARRNPNMVIFMIGIIASLIWPAAGIWGFIAVAVWTWICIAINIGVVVAGTFARKPLSSWMDP